MKRTRYTVKYRLKKDEEYIQERLRWTLEDADKLRDELLTLDYIEYLGTEVREEETNQIIIENKMKMQINHLLDLYLDNDLKEKMYDLLFEWYMRGFTTGVSQFTTNTMESHEHE